MNLIEQITRPMTVKQQEKEIEALKARIAELEAENKRLKAAKGAK